jgi:pyruvate/2-oxoglutarate dehydrogenase complex dihydrolipoamide acyltransferase (E2) component
VAELAAAAANSWIDEDGAASFFELSFRADSVEGAPPTASQAGAGLAGAEVIAAKVYLFAGSGVVLHCVWYRSSIFCVLADNLDDLPLLDVAFPDVTARNRVVQVREYSERTARKLRDAFPGAPAPRALRVWEGRRKSALAEMELEALLRGAAGGGGGGDAKPAPAAAVAAAPAAAATKPVAAAAPVEGDADLYDFSGVKAAAPAAAAAAAPAKGGGAGGGVIGGGGGGAATAASAAAAPALAAGAAAPALAAGAGAPNSAFSFASTRAPHRVAPLVGGGGASGEGEGERSALGARVIMVGSAGGGGGAAPWDASGKPVAIAGKGL